jgi:hypothetical protein
MGEASHDRGGRRGGLGLVFVITGPPPTGPRQARPDDKLRGVTPVIPIRDGGAFLSEIAGSSPAMTH